MRCVIDDDLRSFGAATLPWLGGDPVRHNVLYGLIDQRMRGEVPEEPGCVWARVLDDRDELCGVAIRTPPHPLLLSVLPTGAASALADTLAAALPPAAAAAAPADAPAPAPADAAPADAADAHVDGRLPGANGPASTVRDFVAAWQARTGDAVEARVAQRMYRLDEVIPPAGIAGRLRLATPEDTALAVRWVYGFMLDAGGPHAENAEQEAATSAPRWVRSRQLWLWEVDGVPVSMAARREPVAGVARVSLVYTPIEQRRKGYAAASVAALSQWLLDREATACMLYTDLANPTSNSVYQRIGYRPVDDAEAWAFAPAAD